MSADLESTRPRVAATATLADAGRERYEAALAHTQRGEIDAAIANYEAAVQLAPQFAQAHSNLGTLYLNSGRLSDAHGAYLRALAADPALAAAHCNLATVLITSERFDEAIAACESALHLAPDLFEGWVNLAHAYRRCGRDRDALAPALRAIDLRPDLGAYIGLGVAALGLDAYDLAIAANVRALELDSDCALALCNLGWVYHLCGRYAEAVAACEAAIAREPQLVYAHVNLALSLLVCGEFRRGWDEYDWMWRDPARRAQYRYLDRLPLWNGEPFAGRRLVIAVDQGFGDAIQMLRYLPAIKARGGQVILEVQAALVPLVSQLPDVDAVRVHADTAADVGDVDLQIPILGLPRALATDGASIPAPTAYLQAPPERIERWRSRMAGNARLRVGIVWAGSSEHANDGRRSVRLDDFDALAEIAGIAWFGLQKGRDEGLRSCGSLALDPLGPQIEDFADSAAIVAQLDLVIAVDTSIVHLAGALGKPVWTLLPFAPDWRWLLERDDSPWYPTMRLFRQPAPGDWASVFAAVAHALRAFEPAGTDAAAAPAASPGAAPPTPLDGESIARVYYERAKVRTARNDVGGAITDYETAVAFAPRFAEAQSNLGNLYLQTGRLFDARRAYETAIDAKPNLAPLHCNLATVLIALDCCDEAIAAAQTALRIAPELYEAQVNLGRAYERSGREREALEPALRAIALRPDRDAYADLGAAAFHFDAFEIALEASRRALELDGTCALAHCTIGAVEHLRGRYAEAGAACRTAIAAQPEFAAAHQNLALSRLVCGDFAGGWAEYGWTWRIPERRAQYPYLERVPFWNGEPFAGRTLLIAPDQGFGDAIQMVRYLPAVKALGGRVILEVRPPLGALFAGVPGIDELRIAPDGAPPADDVDLHIPMLGLPGAFATDLNSIPAAVPYLRAQPERIERWRPRLRSAARLRIGIAWAGSPGNPNDRRRSVGLECFAALGDIDGIAWFGLQKGRDEARCRSGSLTLDPLGAEIADFADTAAIIAQLDLVIAVDASVVHLAGALGKPVWTLLPFAPDWRWLLGRDDSPWYPTMRLFRQPAPGDWAAVFAEVARALRGFEPQRGTSPALGREDQRAPRPARQRGREVAGHGEEAIASAQTALEIEPGCAAAQLMGRAHRCAGRESDALAAELRAVDLQPDRAAYVELGNAAFAIDDFALAIEANRRAIALDPDYAGAYVNLGGAYYLTGRYAEARAACEMAIALQPDFALAHFNRGLALLTSGDLASGWEEYAWAARVPANRARYPYVDRVPLWNGEPFVGRRLLIALDQGFGDTIQMLRYLPAVKARGGRVVLEIQAPLLPLVHELAGIDELRVTSEGARPGSDVDLHVPILGLPRACRTRDLASIPAPIPYVHAAPERIERWRPRLRSAARLRVGIVWSGNPGHANDRRRSARLDDFAALGELTDIAWFGLQKGRDEERRSCGELRFEPLGAQIADFGDTAAIVAQLDLVIAVDTSIVHLAGALGKPVWTLLPFAPDWRWLLGRDDSPWYPSMRLFRQPAIGDWASVVAAVVRELRAFGRPDP